MPKNLGRRPSCERSSSTNECSAHRSNEDVWLLRRRRTAGLLLETRLCAPVDRTRLCSLGRNQPDQRLFRQHRSISERIAVSTTSPECPRKRLSHFRVGPGTDVASTIFSSPAVCDLADAVDEQRRHRIRLRLDNLLLHSRHQRNC